jgi:hypothetical protein
MKRFFTTPNHVKRSFGSEQILQIPNPIGGECRLRRSYIGSNLRALRATFFTFLATLFAAFLALPTLVFALFAIIDSLLLCARPSKTLTRTLRSTDFPKALFILNFARLG